MNKLLATLLLVASYCTTWSQYTIEGIITDEQGRPLSGAHVDLLQTDKGAYSGENGVYSISGVNPEHRSPTLRVSYLGYKTETKMVPLQQAKAVVRVNVSLKSTATALAELSVMATRAPAGAPLTYTSLETEKLEVQNLGQDAPYLFRWTPSAVVTSDAGAGVGYTGIRIRGSDPTRINAVINGIPLNDAESQGTFWVDLPDFMSSVESVQIQRGAGTTTNGVGAFGASINLNTHQYRAQPFVETHHSAGSFGLRKHNIIAGSGLLEDRFSVEGRVSTIRSDGYIDRATADLNSYFLNASYWGERTTLHFDLFAGKEVTYQAWYGVPAQYVDDPGLRTYNPAGAKSDGSFHDNQVDDYTQRHYQLHLHHRLSDFADGQVALHYTRGLGFFEEYIDRELNPFEADFSVYGLPDLVVGRDTFSATDLVRRRWLDNHFFGTVFSVNISNPSTPFRWTFGGALNRYLGDHYGEIIWAELAPESGPGFRYYELDARKQEGSVYAKMFRQLGSQAELFADLQFRRVEYRYETFDGEEEDIQLNFFNPKLGVSRRWGPGHNSYLSLGYIHHEPSRADYLDAAAGRRPRPEKLLNVEAGHRIGREENYLKANAYFMYYKDQLALTGAINEDALPVRVNVDRSYRLGLELEGRARLLQRFFLGGAMGLSSNKVERFVEFVDNWDTGEQEMVLHRNTDLAFSPWLVASGQLGYAVLPGSGDGKHELELALLSKYVGEQFIDNTSNPNARLDPYFFNDLRLVYRFRPPWLKELQLIATVNNLWDARYSANAWNYRYISSYDARPDDPYARLEEGNTYTLTGFYPQAGRHFMVSLALKL